MADCGIRLACLAATVVALAAACSKAPVNRSETTTAAAPSSLDQVFGRIFIDADVVVAPDRQLQVDPEGRGWPLNASASIVAAVKVAPQNPMVFSMQVVDGYRRQLRFEWDDAALDATAVKESGSSIEITVPPEDLAPGVHWLTIIRSSPAGAATSGPIVLGDLGYRLGESGEVFDPEYANRLHFLASFMGQGLTGTNPTAQYGGLLFVGPRSESFAIGDGASTDFRSHVHNGSGDPALFTARQGGSLATVRVEPGGFGVLRISVEPGAGPLELSARGEDIGFFLWGAPHLRSAHSENATPIVLITLDTTRRDTVPPYGGLTALLPNLARFASGATVFERAVSTSSWTLPAHASMFTGLYPSRHRAGVVEQGLRGSFRTAAERLGERGYVAAGFAGGAFTSSRFGVGQGFHLYRNPETTETPALQLTQQLLAFLEDYADVPLFLFLNYFDPHYPYEAPPEVRHRVDEFFEVEPSAPAIGGDADFAARWGQAIAGQIALSEGENEALRRAYLAEVVTVDEQLGRVFATLESYGLYDRAIIIITADHGEQLGENGRYGHAYRLDPELVHVPLLIKFPGQTRRRDIGDLVSVVDLFPTLLRAGGIDPPSKRGVVLEASGRTPKRRFAISEEHEMGIHQLFGPKKVAEHLYGVDERGFRSVVWRDGLECARLKGDDWLATPCESPRSAVEDLLRAEFGPALYDMEDAAAIRDELERQMLRALGYVE